MCSVTFCIISKSGTSIPWNNMQWFTRIRGKFQYIKSIPAKATNAPVLWPQQFFSQVPTQQKCRSRRPGPYYPLAHHLQQQRNSKRLNCPSTANEHPYRGLSIQQNRLRRRGRTNSYPKHPEESYRRKIEAKTPYTNDCILFGSTYTMFKLGQNWCVVSHWERATGCGQCGCGTSGVMEMSCFGSGPWLHGCVHLGKTHQPVHSCLHPAFWPVTLH